MERNTTQELLTRSLVFWSVPIFFTFKLTQTYTYKRTELTQSSCTFAYNLKVKEPKQDAVVNSPHRGYTSVEAPLFPCHVPTSVSGKPQLYHVWYRLSYERYVPISGTFFFVSLLMKLSICFKHLVPTTNVPNGPIQTIGHL